MFAVMYRQRQKRDWPYQGVERKAVTGHWQSKID